MSDADSPEPIAESLGVTLDVNDLELEKAFWTAALGREVKTELHGWAAFDLSHGEMLDLQRVPELKSTKNRMQFDLRIRSGDEGIQRLQGLGGSVIDHIVTEVAEWYVMADPEGNQVCAVTRHVNFAKIDGAP